MPNPATGRRGVSGVGLESRSVLQRAPLSKDVGPKDFGELDRGRVEQCDEQQTEYERGDDHDRDGDLEPRT
jgi:hypothetical protein